MQFSYHWSSTELIKSRILVLYRFLTCGIFASSKLILFLGISLCFCSLSNIYYGITEVNFNHLLSSGSNIFDEPFILATQATQVYYVQDSIEKDWYAVVHPPTRDFFDMDARSDGNDEY